MKICICGKGGSGKSTVVALVAGEFRRRGKDVLVAEPSLEWMGLAERIKNMAAGAEAPLAGQIESVDFIESVVRVADGKPSFEST